MENRDGLFERLNAIAGTLKREYKAQRVLLFGSYARGEATANSDLDLLVIAPTNEKFYQRMASVLRTVRGLSRGIPLAPIVLRPEELEQRRKIGDQFVEEILSKGKEL